MKSQQLLEALTTPDLPIMYGLDDKDAASVAAAICDTLGITREMVEEVKRGEAALIVRGDSGEWKAADALTTLLETAGR